MINIIITNTKESQRFPGKNDKLIKYTMEWLNEELNDLNDPNVHVWYFLRETMTDHKCHQYIINDNFHVVYTPDDKTSDSHRDLFDWIQSNVIVDPKERFIQVQLTQPVRRKGLLKDVIKAIDDENLVLTYTQFDDMRWREIMDKGSLPWDYRQKDEKEYKCYYDGAIAGWTGDVSKLFRLYDEKVPKCWIKNTVTPVCDIDSPWQFNHNYISGLKSLAEQNNH